MKIPFSSLALFVVLGGFGATAHAQDDPVDPDEGGFYQSDFNNPEEFNDTLLSRSRFSPGEGRDTVTNAGAKTFTFHWRGATTPTVAVAQYSYDFGGGTMSAAAGPSVDGYAFVSIALAATLSQGGVNVANLGYGSPFVECYSGSASGMVNFPPNGAFANRSIGGGQDVSVTITQDFLAFGR